MGETQSLFGVWSAPSLSSPKLKINIEICADNVAYEKVGKYTATGKWSEKQPGLIEIEWEGQGQTWRNQLKSGDGTPTLTTWRQPDTNLPPDDVQKTTQIIDPEALATLRAGWAKNKA